MNMNTLADPSDDLLPVGAEFMLETPEVPENLGEVACLSSVEGSSDSDGTGTTMSSDPDSMDPRVLFDVEIGPIPDDPSGIK